MKIKNIVILIVLNFLFLGVYAQKENAEIMRYPSEWKFERISFPLDFAKDITWKGYEELRFSPGMFKAESEQYFTYYFGMKIEDKITITKEEIQDMLMKYYKGLCKAVNSNGKFAINYEKIKAIVTKIDLNNYKANITFFDSFTNGKEVDLLMLITTKKDKKNLLVLASVVPSVKESKLSVLHQKNLKENLR
ncbi:hypothetical protein [uncultured Tenacibaculum sp.]|uniref:hypothetical protein n=1 Tax=uncultured Tenacibaculum sp. TaxID=174713 RepID=UPI00260F3957|nr:hypothetical protein [uncultured Tenacibaculum sp.]